MICGSELVMNRELPRILIVDDAPINIQVLNEALAEEYRTCFATTGSDALSVAKQVIPDIILLDVMMPDMDGFTVCRALKSDPRLADIPVIFVTALVQQEQEALGLEAGGVDYIIKPFNPLLVRLRIRNQLELKSQRDQLKILNNRLEAEVKKRTASLEDAVRELEHLFYAISHDLRSPLRHINAFTSLLQESCGDCLIPDCRTYMDRLGNASLRMGRLVDALLSLPRLWGQLPKRDRVDLSSLVHELLAEFALQEPERDLQIKVAEGVVVSGDGELLTVVMRQLLSNAWKFTRGRKPAAIEFGKGMTDGREFFFVRDNGVGFDMAHADKLFGIFQKLHPDTDFEGIGVGLATAQRIIKAHGGTIMAEGSVDGGAAFYFTIPHHPTLNVSPPVSVGQQ